MNSMYLKDKYFAFTVQSNAYFLNKKITFEPQTFEQQCKTCPNIVISSLSQFKGILNFSVEQQFNKL